MTAYPTKPAGSSTSVAVRKAVIPTSRDLVEASPDTLTLLKRLVNDFDLLEVSNHTAWATAVSLIGNVVLQRMFQGCRFDRERSRHRIYGSDSVTLGQVYSILFAAITPATSGASGWLRNDAVAGDVTSWTEVLTANHATANVARAPTATAASGLTFTTNDCMAWTLNATTFNTSYLGFYLWVKPDDVATNKTLVSISIGTGGAFARCIILMFGTTSFMCDVFVAGTAGRRGIVAGQVAAGTPRLWGVEYNNDKVGEANKLTLTRDGAVLAPTFSDLGAGGALGALPTATPGKALIGNFNDGAASNPMNGVIGRNLFSFTAPMVGSTVGLLTTAARNSLLALEPLV